MKRTDFLDFAWRESDDMNDIKNKYDDFIRQEKTTGQGAGNRTGGEFGWTSRKPGGRMGSRPNDMYDMYNDEFEDELEDDRPPPPKQTEKRFLNGKHILTNGEITCVSVVSQAV